MIVSLLLLILHKKIQFYIFMFEPSNVAKGCKVQGGRILSQGTVVAWQHSLLLAARLFSVLHVLRVNKKYIQITHIIIQIVYLYSIVLYSNWSHRYDELDTMLLTPDKNTIDKY